MTEAQFQRSVIELAQLNGWRVFHARKAQNGKGQWRTPVAADGAGFPDLVLVKHTIIFAELKTDTGRLSPTQREWFNALTRAHASVVEVWRPKDWPHIERVLTGKPAERTPF